MQGPVGRGVLNGKKKSVPVSQKSPRALHVLNHGWWQLARGCNGKQVEHKST